MPRLTVIMPAWNAESTISAALRSTLVAMPKDAEILVYDDASTDGTRRIVRRFSDRTSRVSLIEGSSNVGAGEARNQLLGRSDSEFVAAMDADDVCLPYRFLAYRRQMAESHLIFAPIARFGRRTRLHVPRPAPLSSAAMPLALLVLNPVPQSTMIARRDALDGQATYRPGHAEDYELWLRLAASGVRISFTSIPTVAYRHHPDQATSQPGYEMQVRDNERLTESYRVLADGLLGADASGSDITELRAELAAKVDQMESLLDRYHLRRLLNSPWSFPLRPVS
jgi:glycosyltransferase involved in cell wall biosynthesis